MRPLRILPDDDGAIDVPYRLLLSVVLIAMATAVLYPALQAYSRSEMEHRLTIASREICSAAESVHRNPGSSRTVHIDVPSSGIIRLTRLTIGGDQTSSLANPSILVKEPVYHATPRLNAGSEDRSPNRVNALFSLENMFLAESTENLHGFQDSL